MRSTRHLILAMVAALLLSGCASGGRYGDVNPVYADRGATVVAEGVPVSR